jgi:GAF domain-containing protein
VRTRVAAHALLDRRMIHIPDRHDPTILAEFPDIVHRRARATLSVPLMRQGEGISVLSVARMVAGELSQREIALVETFADQAVIAIENAPPFEELDDSNAGLREALERQTATADVLRVVASSPSSLQASLDAILVRAARLGDADIGWLFKE